MIIYHSMLATFASHERKSKLLFSYHQSAIFCLYSCRISGKEKLATYLQLWSTPISQFSLPKIVIILIHCWKAIENIVYEYLKCQTYVNISLNCQLIRIIIIKKKRIGVLQNMKRVASFSFLFWIWKHYRRSYGFYKH